MDQSLQTTETPPSPLVRLIAPVPIEALVVIEPLSGRDGTNRSRSGHCQIAADTDRDAVLAWLARYAGSPNTFSNCRKEAERLLLWSLVELGQPLSSLTHEDLLRYQQFMGNPQPAERWVMGGGRKLPRSYAGWRPFAGPPVARQSAPGHGDAQFNVLLAGAVWLPCRQSAGLESPTAHTRRSAGGPFP